MIGHFGDEKVGRDGAKTSSGSSFQIWGPETSKARLPTVESDQWKLCASEWQQGGTIKCCLIFIKFKPHTFYTSSIVCHRCTFTPLSRQPCNTYSTCRYTGSWSKCTLNPRYNSASAPAVVLVCIDISVLRCTVIFSQSPTRQKLSVSRSCLHLGHLRLVSKTNFRPHCAGWNNKTSQFNRRH